MRWLCLAVTLFSFGVWIPPVHIVVFAQVRTVLLFRLLLVLPLLPLLLLLRPLLLLLLLLLLLQY